MKILANCVRDFLLLISFVTICSANNSDEGYLNTPCDTSLDCYVLDRWLHLQCDYDVHKCKCKNTISSNFTLKWENQQCLNSKYGLCGGEGELKVGCQDDFICVDNQCRDPADPSPRTLKLTPYTFDDTDCSRGDCTFSNKLRLQCNRKTRECECEEIYLADSRSYWSIRNYEGNKNCSVGKFGPCGTKNGVTIECHGEGITCVDGTCLDADHPISEAGGDCASVKNCKEGLLCSRRSICIEKFSLSEGEACYESIECQRGLRCFRRGWDVWDWASCVSTKPSYDGMFV